MAMEAAVHKRNLESSILFMQQEHAITLKALHEEIHKLQKKCTDLTFQLTMHGISVDDDGDVDSRLKEVHEQLQASQSKENVAASQVAEQQQRMHALEQELRVLKKRHLDDMRNASQTISGLKAEVEAKSNNIAFLTTELHRLKVKQKADPGGGGMEAAAQDAGGPTIVRRMQPQYGHLPVPPRDMLTNSARLRHHRAAPHPAASPAVRVGGRPGAVHSTSTTSVAANMEADLLGRSLRVTSASARSSGSDSPDISPFVQRNDLLEGAMSVVEVKKPAPLPPIASAPTKLGLGERDMRLDEKDVRRQVVIAKRGHHGVTTRPRPMTPEVTTLAVDQVSDANWKRPSESHSSEYN